MSKKENEKQIDTLAEAIKTGMSVDSAGLLTDDEAVYNANLPEGITPELTEKLEQYNVNFIAAGASAAKDVAFDAMEKNAKLDEVSGRLHVGAFGHADLKVVREKAITIPPREKGGEATKGTSYGAMSVDVTFTAGKRSGFLEKAIQAAKTEGAERFGKK